MTDLKIRRIPFSFEDVPFIWNPENPGFSIAMNKLSFFAIGFEKYICQAMADVEPRIKDPAILAEVRAFRAQEGIHSNAHRRHVKALIKQYPALQEALDKTIKSYDELYASKPLEYHLAYIGGLESIFTPSFKLLLDHRHLLFEGGDARVASLMLWHFCEEIEHRSSGLVIYNHVVGKYLYRVGNFTKFMGHVKEVTDMLGEEFKKHVPGITDDLVNFKSKASPLPKIAKLRSSYGILMSQMPWHNPDHQALPAYFQEWSDQYDRGDDMTQTYGVRWEKQPELIAAE
ncbi:metal-dependent hydrolase [Sphingomonas solaris]|uniref:Metal-dependent hydrolase n=1 Tax=Alterirhizorhabdus solaris TaxID=2529389 RepID=A0A558RBN7_9SPHN|nr:metal-dependent hydrolase [Sphingomonas solaris]TVV76771.1 metal-dependent hydrolase [Sphingomonas solaris]